MSVDTVEKGFLRRHQCIDILRPIQTIDLMYAVGDTVQKHSRTLVSVVNTFTYFKFTKILDLCVLMLFLDFGIN